MCRRVGATGSFALHRPQLPLPLMGLVSGTNGAAARQPAPPHRLPTEEPTKRVGCPGTHDVLGPFLRMRNVNEN
jgi:hypothetical protein